MSESEFQKGSSEGKETEGDFAKRVLERTGVSLEKMEEGAEDDLIGSHIFCRHGDTWIVATGHPTRVDEETGIEFWDDPKCFRKVTLK